MQRKGIHRPTIEDLVELSGIETLHPGGMALTRRSGEVAELGPGKKILDVSSGRGSQAIFYAQEFGVEVTGLDLSPQMVNAARQNAAAAGLNGQVRFEQGDSQHLPFGDRSFDAAINECAVGIPDDSQAVLSEMVRVVRPGGMVVIHESIWQSSLSAEERQELAERYGTTPLERDQWVRMLVRAGAEDLHWECEPWSRPEMFWQIRRDRQVKSHRRVLTLGEKLHTLGRVLAGYGPAGVFKALSNERLFYQAVLGGKLGYCLFWGRRAAHLTES